MLLAQSLSWPCEAIYEAGATGFELKLVLENFGIECVVANPSQFAKSKAQRQQKNDYADARYLAELLANSFVPEVWVPDSHIIELREISRVWNYCREDIALSKRQLDSYMLRHSYSLEQRDANYYGLETSCLSDAALEFYKTQLDAAHENEDIVSDLAKDVIEKESLGDTVNAIDAIWGISLRTAFALTVETGSFSRFNHPKKYASWLGLTPENRMSGSKKSHGHITCNGHEYVRKGLVDAAFAYNNKQDKRLQEKRLSGLPNDVSQIIVEGEQAIHDKRAAFSARGVNKRKANTAIARELSQLVWEVGTAIEEAA